MALPTNPNATLLPSAGGTIYPMSGGGSGYSLQNGGDGSNMGTLEAAAKMSLLPQNPVPIHPVQGGGAYQIPSFYYGGLAPNPTMASAVATTVNSSTVPNETIMYNPSAPMMNVPIMNMPMMMSAVVGAAAAENTSHIQSTPEPSTIQEPIVPVNNSKKNQSNTTNTTNTTTENLKDGDKEIILFGKKVLLPNPSSQQGTELTEGQKQALLLFGLDHEQVTTEEKKEVLQVLYEGTCTSEKNLIMLDKCEPIRKIIKSLALRLLSHYHTTNDKTIRNMTRDKKSKVSVERLNDGSNRVCITYTPEDVSALTSTPENVSTITSNTVEKSISDQNTTVGTQVSDSTHFTKRGIPNQGVQCYCISVIQLLYSLPPFRKAILNYTCPQTMVVNDVVKNKKEKASAEEIVCVIRSIFNDLSSQSGSFDLSANMEDLDKAKAIKKPNRVSFLSEQLIPSQEKVAQQDAVEMLRNLFSLLKEIPVCKDVISSFEIQLHHDSKCSKEDNWEKTGETQSIMDLPLPAKALVTDASEGSNLYKLGYDGKSGISMDKLISYYEREQHIDSIKSCNGQSGYMRYRIQPNSNGSFLFVSLYRTSQESNISTHDSSIRVDVPSELTLTYTSLEAEKQSSSSTSPFGKESDQVNTYRIYGIIIYSGEGNQGHYQYLRLHYPQNADSNKELTDLTSLLYDDDKNISLNKLQKDVLMTQSYLLVYQRHMLFGTSDVPLISLPGTEGNEEEKEEGQEEEERNLEGEYLSAAAVNVSRMDELLKPAELVKRESQYVYFKHYSELMDMLISEKQHADITEALVIFKKAVADNKLAELVEENVNAKYDHMIAEFHYQYATRLLEHRRKKGTPEEISEKEAELTERSYNLQNAKDKLESTTTAITTAKDSIIEKVNEYIQSEQQLLDELDEMERDHDEKELEAEKQKREADEAAAKIAYEKELKDLETQLQQQQQQQQLQQQQLQQQQQQQQLQQQQEQQQQEQQEQQEQEQQEQQQPSVQDNEHKYDPPTAGMEAQQVQLALDEAKAAQEATQGVVDSILSQIGVLSTGIVPSVLPQIQEVNDDDILNIQKNKKDDYLSSLPSLNASVAASVAALIHTSEEAPQPSYPSASSSSSSSSSLFTPSVPSDIAKSDIQPDEEAAVQPDEEAIVQPEEEAIVQPDEEAVVNPLEPLLPVDQQWINATMLRFQKQVEQKQIERQLNILQSIKLTINTEISGMKISKKDYSKNMSNKTSPVKREHVRILEKTIDAMQTYDTTLDTHKKELQIRLIELKQEENDAKVKKEEIERDEKWDDAKRIEMEERFNQEKNNLIPSLLNELHDLRKILISLKNKNDIFTNPIHMADKEMIVKFTNYSKTLIQKRQTEALLSQRQTNMVAFRPSLFQAKSKNYIDAEQNVKQRMKEIEELTVNAEKKRINAEKNAQSLAAVPDSDIDIGLKRVYDLQYTFLKSRIKYDALVVYLQELDQTSIFILFWNEYYNMYVEVVRNIYMPLVKNIKKQVKDLNENIAKFPLYLDAVSKKMTDVLQAFQNQDRLNERKRKLLTKQVGSVINNISQLKTNFNNSLSTVQSAITFLDNFLQIDDTTSIIIVIDNLFKINRIANELGEHYKLLRTLSKVLESTDTLFTDLQMMNNSTRYNDERIDYAEMMYSIEIEGQVYDPYEIKTIIDQLGDQIQTLLKPIDDFIFSGSFDSLKEYHKLRLTNLEKKRKEKANNISSSSSSSSLANASVSSLPSQAQTDVDQKQEIALHNELEYESEPIQVNPLSNTSAIATSSSSTPLGPLVPPPKLSNLLPSSITQPNSSTSVDLSAPAPAPSPAVSSTPSGPLVPPPKLSNLLPSSITQPNSSTSVDLSAPAPAVPVVSSESTSQLEPIGDFSPSAVEGAVEDAKNNNGLEMQELSAPSIFPKKLNRHHYQNYITEEDKKEVESVPVISLHEIATNLVITAVRYVNEEIKDEEEKEAIMVLLQKQLDRLKTMKSDLKIHVTKNYRADATYINASQSIKRQASQSIKNEIDRHIDWIEKTQKQLLEKQEQFGPNTRYAIMKLDKLLPFLVKETLIESPHGIPQGAPLYNSYPLYVLPKIIEVNDKIKKEYDTKGIELATRLRRTIDPSIKKRIEKEIEEENNKERKHIVMLAELKRQHSGLQKKQGALLLKYYDSISSMKRPENYMEDGEPSPPVTLSNPKKPSSIPLTRQQLIKKQESEIREEKNPIILREGDMALSSLKELIDTTTEEIFEVIYNAEENEDQSAEFLELKSDLSRFISKYDEWVAMIEDGSIPINVVKRKLYDIIDLANDIYVAMKDSYELYQLKNVYMILHLLDLLANSHHENIWKGEIMRKDISRRAEQEKLNKEHANRETEKKQKAKAQQNERNYRDASLLKLFEKLENTWNASEELVDWIQENIPIPEEENDRGPYHKLHNDIIQISAEFSNIVEYILDLRKQRVAKGTNVVFTDDNKKHFKELLDNVLKHILQVKDTVEKVFGEVNKTDELLQKLEELFNNIDTLSTEDGDLQSLFLSFTREKNENVNRNQTRLRDKRVDRNMTRRAKKEKAIANAQTAAEKKRENNQRAAEVEAERIAEVKRKENEEKAVANAAEAKRKLNGEKAAAEVKRKSNEEKAISNKRLVNLAAKKKEEEQQLLLEKQKLERYKTLKTELIEKQLEKKKKEEESIRASESAKTLQKTSNQMEKKYANPSLTLIKKGIKNKYMAETGKELTQHDVIKKMADDEISTKRQTWPKLLIEADTENSKSKDARESAFKLKKEIESLKPEVEQLENELQGLNPAGLKKIMDLLPKLPSDLDVSSSPAPSSSSSSSSSSSPVPSSSSASASASSPYRSHAPVSRAPTFKRDIRLGNKEFGKVIHAASKQATSFTATQFKKRLNNQATTRLQKQFGTPVSSVQSFSSSQTKPVPVLKVNNKKNNTTRKVNKSLIQRQLNESKQRLNAKKAEYEESKARRIAAQESLEATRKRLNEPFSNIPSPAPSAPSVPSVKMPFKSSANLRRNVLRNTIKKKEEIAKTSSVRNRLVKDLNQLERTKSFPATADQSLYTLEKKYNIKPVKRGGTRRKS